MRPGKEYLSVAIRVLISGTFLLSAIAKGSPISAFEFELASTGFFQWEHARVLARILIGFEGALGTIILFGVALKTAYRVSLFLLSCFSVYLIYLLFMEGNIGNCGCFGTLIPMSPLLSLVKNIVLMTFSLVGLAVDHDFLRIRKARISLWVTILIIGMGFPFFHLPLNGEPEPPDPENPIGSKLDLSNIQMNEDWENIDLERGKRIVAFLSMDCSYCQRAAMKFNILQDRSRIPFPVYFIFYGEKKDLKVFWKKTGSSRFPYTIIPLDEFRDLAGPHLPSVYLLKDGKIVDHLLYPEIKESTIREFLKKDQIGS